MRDARPATSADDEALRRLSRACAMHGSVGYTLEREPDFFALTRLQGSSWETRIVEGDGGPIAMGTIVRVQRRIAGAVHRVGYAADLKVHPDHRGAKLAGALLRSAVEMLAAEGLWAYGVVLAGNRAMASIVAGEGLGFARRAVVRKRSLFPLCVPRPEPGIRVRRARAEDLGAVAALWHRAGGDFAPCWDEEGLAAQIARTPGLRVDDLLLAEKGGRLVAAGAPWDASAVRQIRLTHVVGGVRALRAAWNPVARTIGRAPLTEDGGVLPFRTMSMLAAETAEGLRALVLTALRQHDGNWLYLDVALDARDRKAAALRGLWGPPVDFDLYTLVPNGRPTPETGEGLVAVELALA